MLRNLLVRNRSPWTEKGRDELLVREIRVCFNFQWFLCEGICPRKRMKCWHRLPTDVMGSPSMGYFNLTRQSHSWPDLLLLIIRRPPDVPSLHMAMTLIILWSPPLKTPLISFIQQHAQSFHFLVLGLNSESLALPSPTLVELFPLSHLTWCCRGHCRFWRSSEACCLW